MGTSSIPVRLTLAESCAVALLEAAADLDRADDSDKFLSALDRNHRLWISLVDIAARNGWDVPSQRLGDFVINSARRAGAGIRDEHVEVLIGINRETSSKLTSGRDLSTIRTRAELAWAERGGPNGMTMVGWLMTKMNRGFVPERHRQVETCG